MPTRPQLQKLVERVRFLAPLPIAFVHPCDAESLQLALAGAFAGYLAPTLVGPETRIRDVALRAGLDISRLPVVDSADDGAAAAERAVQLAREGRTRALIKGSLSDGALLAPVAALDSGLRTNRRLSHATILDIPGRAQLLIVTDDRLNVAPNLAAKREILVNAVELAIALGVAAPAVALLAAVDAPSAAFPSTVDAASLKAIAGDGTIRGARVDGPMTPDVALSPEAARQHGVASEVAGHADILVAPTMEAAVMVVRTLCGATGALAAGLVLGAQLPIVLVARGEPLESRMASCVLASLIASGQLDGRQPAPQRSGNGARVGAEPAAPVVA
ncbi:MAG: bifunctional enoyl-CoA hydratase/phosphate acetyltransferase [Betaproteobacteria bacterium]